ncbi:MAG: endonuclease/exonuclease/phosphatase family protein [Akkermansiaceae bacterium]
MFLTSARLAVLARLAGVFLCLSLTVALPSHAADLAPTKTDPHPETLRVMTYNIWYVFAKGKQQTEGKAWINSQAPDVVALQELTNIKPQKLQELASGWGHKHSSLLKTSGFSVGLTSRWQIEVVTKKIKGMHHGYLHAKTGGVHYFVVHLSPFKWKVRQAEAEILLAEMTPLIKSGQKVIVLGDFNTVSPADKQWLESDKNAEQLASKKKSDAKHGHVQNLKNGAFDYEVMEKFFRGGLIDTADGHLAKTFAARLSIPTGIWTDKKSAVKLGERIDFILASKNLQQRVKKCQIVTAGIVNQISDHYPVITDFSLTN